VTAPPQTTDPGAGTTVPCKVLLTGGGTGGHVYPLLEILRMLRQAGRVSDVLYVGTGTRAEETIVSRMGDMPMVRVPAAAVHGQSLRHLPGTCLKIAAGTFRACGVLLRYRPRLVLASGGYVSAPVCFAARLLRPLLGTRLVIHEQNLMPGLMNKVASLFADAVMVSYRESPYFLWSTRCVYTGYPVRRDIRPGGDRQAAKLEARIEPGHRVVLVLGGSMGSRSINRVVPAVIPALRRGGSPVTLVHAVGLGTGDYRPWEDTLERVRRALGPSVAERQLDGGGLELTADGGLFRHLLFPYLHDIPRWLTAADVVVCRAGSGTIHEIIAAGRGAVVIPKRGLPGDHQELNAIRLAEAGACVPIFERREPGGIDFVDPGELAEALTELLTCPERIDSLAEAAAALRTHDTPEQVVDTIDRVVQGRRIEGMAEILEPQSVGIRKLVDTLADFLHRQPKDSFYRRLYAIKMDEYLAADDWHQRNIGVKLAGALGRSDRIPRLLALYPGGTGYVRRNILRALNSIGLFDDAFPDLVFRGIGDPYFEARAAAFAMAGTFSDRLSDNRALVEAMTRAFRSRLQHVEVRIEALRVLPLFIPLDDYFGLAGEYRFAQNARLRQAILEGLQTALRKGCITGHDLERTRAFTDEMLITTSDFAPRFRIRQSFLDLQERIDAVLARERGNDG
jgi:UDP-N-acetylglucosamine--N-acetylmuramyl-(pentapeptide) pyrophosphoryl-undecaprenol N-acetylglucosamine transferase